MSHAVFIARQPIFDRAKNVFGYELLHRSDRQKNHYAHTNGNQASTAVMNTTLNIVGLSELTGDRHMFINITRDLLLTEGFSVLPPGRTVVELLENVEPDAEVVAACQKLKEAGYLLALDDFVFTPKYRPLVDLADIIKVDFIASTAAQRKDLARHLAGSPTLLLAEKVECQDDLSQALDTGYTYFQGYFFCKPQVFAGRDFRGHKQSYLRLLRELMKPELEFQVLEEVIKADVTLTTKLLRYLNSASLGLRAEIKSIHQALTLLGERPVRRWGSLAAMASMGTEKPTELAVTCLVRARFCELIAFGLGMGDRQLDLFLLGLLSGLDAMLDQPLAEVLSHIPIAHDVTAALLGAKTRLGKVYGMVLALERGHWGHAATTMGILGLQQEYVAQSYRDAIQWADQVFAT